MHLKVITSILSLVWIGSQGHPLLSIRESDPIGGSGNSICESGYYGFQSEWRNCLSVDYKTTTSPGYVLTVLEKMCKDDSAKKCMQDKLGKCNKWPRIETSINESTSFCQNNDVPSDWKTFLTDNAENTLSSECLKVAFDFEYDVSTIPTYNTSSIEAERNFYTGLVAWLLKHYKAIPNRDEVIVGCDGMTRQTVFGIHISSIATVFFGVNVYEFFDDYMRSGQPAGLLERMILQRSMFYPH